MNAIARDQARVTKPATLAGSGLALAVVAFVGTALADAAWGWGGLATALYSLGSILLMVSAFLLVVTQVQVSRAHGGLGRAALIGVGISALGALLTFVSWAVVVWATVLGLGTLLFGAAILRHGRVPRGTALALTWAAPAVSVSAWAAAVLSGGVESSPFSTASYVVAAAALLVLAWALMGVGRWLASAGPESATGMAAGTRGTAYR